MINLGLDLAAKTGYAIRYDIGEWKAGVWYLDRGNLGGARSPIPAVRLLKRLEKLSETYEIKSVAFEETFARGNAKFRLDSLQTIVMIWAIQRGIPWMRLSVGTVKKHATGFGRATKREMLRMAWCNRDWKNVEIWSADQADALWVLDCALQEGS